VTMEQALTRVAALALRIDAPAASADRWRIQVLGERLFDVMQILLDDLRSELFLVAGEDRAADDEIRVHYLLGVPAPSTSSRWSLVEVEVVTDRRRPQLPTLAGLSFPASRFERELRDMLGVEPVGHPDPRPLVRHGFWPESFHPLREDAVPPVFEDDGRPFPFTEVAGDGVYEIPVGPVHAGIIEPGHFRFSVLGETILKMRARLYFTHKGTEKLFEGRTPDEGVELAERISGDTGVGHALAFCQAIESLAGMEAPPGAAAIRTVLLELERLYNHIADVGALAADTGFAIGQSHCLRLREAALRLNKLVAGHRLLRGVVVPGGVRISAADLAAVELVPALARLAVDFDEVVGICLENTLVRDRLETTGRLAVDVARDFGVVGGVARSCGIGHDMRVDVPFAAYDRLRVAPVVETSGDVRARFLVRVRETRAAVGLIEEALELARGAVLRVPVGALRALTPSFGIVEAWRGRITHMAIAGQDGRLRRVKIVDPSFFNWPALARALEDSIVPDFPLCNKSFNLSYSGNDL
jgi:Ni,Fe-hydrogenase III large subunit/Ni,Fe-hydrogenase III component G